MTTNYMLKIQPLKCSDIPLFLNEMNICSTAFFNRLQQLKYSCGCHILFERAHVAGNGYCFDEQGNIIKDTEGYKIKFDYRPENTTDKNHLYFILF